MICFLDIPFISDGICNLVIVVSVWYLAGAYSQVRRVYGCLCFEYCGDISYTGRMYFILFFKILNLIFWQFCTFIVNPVLIYTNILLCFCSFSYICDIFLLWWNHKKCWGFVVVHHYFLDYVVPLSILLQELHLSFVYWYYLHSDKICSISTVC